MESKFYMKWNAYGEMEENSQSNSSFAIFMKAFKEQLQARSPGARGSRSSSL